MVKKRFFVAGILALMILPANCVLPATQVQASSLSTTTRVTAGMRPTTSFVSTHKSWSRTISDDGRFSVFISSSPQLIPNDVNSTRDLFIYDREAKKLEIVRGNSGEQPNSWALSATISGDGRFVAFFSYATNLIPGASDLCKFGCINLYVYDRHTKQTMLANRSSQGRLINVSHNNVIYDQPVLSRDGRFIAFRSEHALSPKDNNHSDDIMLRDLKTGVTQALSVDHAGRSGLDQSISPSISQDGRYVSFVTASQLVPDDQNDTYDVYLREVQLQRTTLITRGPLHAPTNAGSTEAVISQDGRHIAFRSWASNLVPGDINQEPDIFLYDTVTGSTRCVSAPRQAGVQANDASYNPDISGDGRFVVYASRATNLVRVDTNDELDIFIYDRDSGLTRRVSRGSYDGPQANNYSHSPSISADGKTVSFVSDATNISAEPEADIPPEQVYLHHNPVAHTPYYDPIDLLDLTP
jgi:Tol biopolymer transport system component